MEMTTVISTGPADGRIASVRLPSVRGDRPGVRCTSSADRPRGRNRSSAFPLNLDPARDAGPVRTP
jgi:hypothetical protein